ncbi:MAG: 50S ribosomal protein L5 [Candidatus Aenigmatarchaeota archaeon]
MREIRLAKVTINMGAGESGPKLEKCRKIIEIVTGKKSVTTITKKRSTFGVAKHRPIGVKVTVRGEEAKSLLKKLLHAVDNKLKESCFDENGNFSFGIQEYIHIPGVRYDPDVGILGMDVAVTLERPGFRIKKRRIRHSVIGKSHRIKKEEAIDWARKNLNVEIVQA